MPLNKFAAWGLEPVVARRPSGLGAVTRLGLAAIDASLAKGLPGPTQPLVKTPSSEALRVVWSLNAVRDALSDQQCASVDDTNAQIDNRRQSHAVVQIDAFLEEHYPELVAPFRLQFRSLQAGDVQAFDLQRRERLAELATFELLVMATVQDPTPHAAPIAPVSRSARKRR